LWVLLTVPNAISEAMRQRWTIIPVLMPLEMDFPQIVLSIANGLNPALEVDHNDNTLLESANRFYKANAAPREIREALIASMAIIPGELEIKHIEFASIDIIPTGNMSASIYADYCALAYCRNNSFCRGGMKLKTNPLMGLRSQITSKKY
jgi:hypothetical protein